MARTINEQEYAEKRKDILDAAQQLIFSMGYERMTIQDILSELHISSGAFYHYFDSKPAVLEAFIERQQRVAEQPLLPIVNDPNLPALAKLQRYLDTLDTLSSAHLPALVELLRVWYTDENAIVRQKADEATLQRRAPLLSAIVRQGLQESVFKNAYPDQAGEVILSLWQGMGSTHARLLLDLRRTRDEAGCIHAIVATQAAYLDAIERVLGAPAYALVRVDPAAVRVWVSALLN